MKTRPDRRLLFALSGFLFLGCQYLPGDSGGKSLTDRLALLLAVPNRVTTGGAVIQAPTMTLTVPQGALNQETTITYAQTSLPDQKGSVLPVQAAYTFGPANLQFNKPATMKICYDAKDLAARNLNEATMQIQYLTSAGNFVSMGGSVDLSHHCVSAPIYHFSTYVLTAQLLEGGDNPPAIGGADFFPNTPIAGLPLVVRTNVTDWDAGSSVAAVRLFYRTAGSAGAYTPLAMAPETNDGTDARFYQAKIPAADVTVAGIEYYLEAFDTLNKGSTTGPATVGVLVRYAADPVQFDTLVTQMSAGFSRDLTVQVRGDTGSGPTAWFPVPAETMSFDGDKGVTSRPTWLNVRYTAQTIGSTNLLAAYGDLNLAQPAAVYPGLLTTLKVLYNDVELPDPFVVNGPSVTQLDMAGYDVYGNFMYVLPALSTTGGIGTFGNAANYGKLTAPYVFPGASGTIVASLGGYNVSYNVSVVTTAVICEFNNAASTFNDGCVFNF